MNQTQEKLQKLIDDKKLLAAAIDQAQELCGCKYVKVTVNKESGKTTLEPQCVIAQVAHRLGVTVLEMLKWDGSDADGCSINSVSLQALPGTEKVKARFDIEFLRRLQGIWDSSGTVEGQRQKMHNEVSEWFENKVEELVKEYEPKKDDEPGEDDEEVLGEVKTKLKTGDVQKGDKVLFVDNDYGNDGLVKGQVYEVAGVNEYGNLMLLIDGMERGGFYHHRFELVEKAKPKLIKNAPKEMFRPGVKVVANEQAMDGITEGKTYTVISVSPSWDNLLVKVERDENRGVGGYFHHRFDIIDETVTE